MKQFFVLFLMLASTTAALAQQARTVVVFGDSITAGSALPSAERGAAWVNRVQLAGGDRLRMINEGKGGRPTDSEGEFRAVLSRHPHADLLVLALGTNDSRDVTAACVPKAVAHLRQMMQAAREHWGSGLALLILGPPNIRKDALGPTKPIAEQREAKLRELGAAFAQLAGEEGADYLSLYGVVSPGALAKDGVHPDAAGNEEIAKVVLPKILATLGSR